jgi:thiol-disulfide isomerase/thioredoxin
LHVNDWGEKRPVLVFSADRTRGGVVGVSKADDGKEVTVALGPAVRVKGKLECKELNGKPTGANTTVTADGFRAYFTQFTATAATFEFILPIGKYTVGTYGSDVEAVKQTPTFTADRPVVDLGTIDMKASAIAKLKGKPAPEWVIADARGVKPEVRLADYKGKWVYIEFWGFWCGPCVAGALPELIGLYEDYAGQRDKFAILAIHERGVKSFAELDKKLPKIKDRYWQGKDLPFPILLDATGATAKLYGISAYPTHILIDPDGKLVGETEAAELTAKLPPLSAAKVWARQRDLQRNIFWSHSPGGTLTKYAEGLKRWTHCDVEFDANEIKAAGLTLDGPLPSVIVGGPITLRSIEDLTLGAHGLSVAPLADGKTLLITKRQTASEPESYSQKLHAKEISKRLDRGPTVDEQDKTKPLEIKDQQLVDAIKLIVNEFNLPMALDGKAMLAGTLDPAAKVSGRIDPGHLRKSLTQLVEPLGLMIDVRLEVVFVTPAGTKP